MEEKELIAKIRQLKQIKPNQDWVSLTKTQIFGQETARGRVSGWLFSFWRPVWKPALATITTFGILFCLFTFSQNALPGDFLYSLKKVTEKAQAVFLSLEERPQASLELANKRLEELSRVARTNQVENLAPAISEFKVSVSKAAESLTKIETSDPAKVKKVVDQAKSIESKVKEVKSYGVVIEDGDLKELQDASKKLELQALIPILTDLISDLENRTLSEKQEEILAQMKELVDEERYSEALELYLINQ